jgi:hypothetical protein
VSSSYQYSLCQFSLSINFVTLVFIDKDFHVNEQMECGNAQLGEIFNKNNFRCRSWDGYVQFRYLEPLLPASMLIHAWVNSIQFDF